MAEVIHFEAADLPKVYLVGKEIRHNIEDYTKGHNRIPAFWDKCLADGTFSALEKQQNYIYEPAYVGACIDWGTGYGTFSYICGMLFRESVTVPDGYAIRKIGGEKIGICWIKGKDAPDVTSSAHTLTMEAIRNAGLCPNQMKWSMQLFTNSRFSVPDEKGEVILDYYIPLAKSFESLGNRLVDSYIKTYPAFKPVKECNASENSQKQMYDFLYESLTTIYSDLSMFNISHEPDDYYESWQLMNTKPELNKKTQKIKYEFFAVYEYFNKMGLAGQVLQDSLFIAKGDLQIKQKMKDKLRLFGLVCEEKADGYSITHNKYKEIFSAWKLHCSSSKYGNVSTNEIMHFLHGRFMDKMYTAAEMFSKVSDSVLISELEQYFLEKGYTCNLHEIGIKYEKEYPKKQTAHMNIYYDWRKINPLILDFKAPHFSKVITFYDEMDDELKDMVFNKTKTCDGCGYCVQTDKTGKRPKLAQCLEFNDVKKLKCPLYPSFVWDNVNTGMISKVKKLFDFVESVVK